MPQTIQTLLIKYLQEIRKIYGTHLKKVILYGSYAEMDAYADQLSELGFEYNVDYDIWMMPVVKNKQHFEKWAEVYPFYANVQREGVTLYEAA